MKVLYTVDRLGSLKEGANLSMIPNPIDNDPFKTIIETRYPNGLSAHGCGYIAEPNCKFSNNNGALELYFEEVRASHYSCIPSRFESIFCCESLEEAIRMREKISKKNPSAAIFEVYPMDITHKANMDLLNSSDSLLAMVAKAHSYWKGEALIPQHQPTWEVIAKLPVVIGNKVG